MAERSNLGRTVASVACEVSGGTSFSAILDEAMEWPPDLFAITSTILGLSGAYRRVVSPPREKSWPASGDLEVWEGKVRADADEWRQAVDLACRSGGRFAPPTWFAAWRAELEALGTLLLHDLDEQWDALAVIFQAHALADEASEGLGFYDHGYRRRRGYKTYEFIAMDKLSFEHTLSNFPVDRVRVLPKSRTPQSGITIRSLSHHLAVEHCDVDVEWINSTHPAAVDAYMRLRLLLFPWPFSTTSDEFSPVFVPPEDPKPLFARLPAEKFGFFDFRPLYDPRDLFSQFTTTVEKAAEFGDIDGVVLPEASVSEEEFSELWSIAERKGIHILLAGVRGADRDDPRRGRNAAALRVSRLDGADTFDQEKHHRWFLDRSQIDSYELAHVLNPARRWWENTVVGRRKLNVVAFNDWLTLCHLICEDLARIDPVSRLVRAIGPTLVVALLLDGPQLPSRWPGRYATVLADDPGSSVLTLTSLGMALRSRPRDGTGRVPSSRVIALWKDSRFGDRTIDLAEGATGVVLTLWGEHVEEFTADGRSDRTGAGRITLGEVAQVRSG